MPTRRSICLFALLAVSPLLSWGQAVAPSGRPPKASDLAHKTFEIGEPAAWGKDAQEFHQYFIFHEGDSATYRGTRGTTISRDSPLRWRVVGDSLHLLPGPVILEAEGTTHRIARAPLTYAVVPVAGGYLLRRKGEQMRLREVK